MQLASKRKKRTRRLYDFPFMFKYGRKIASLVMGFDQDKAGVRTFTRSYLSVPYKLG